MVPCPLERGTYTAQILDAIPLDASGHCTHHQGRSGVATSSSQVSSRQKPTRAISHNARFPSTVALPVALVPGHFYLWTSPVTLFPSIPSPLARPLGVLRLENIVNPAIERARARIAPTALSAVLEQQPQQPQPRLRQQRGAGHGHNKRWRTTPAYRVAGHTCQSPCPRSSSPARATNIQ